MLNILLFIFYVILQQIHLSKQNIYFGYNTLYLWQELVIKLTKTIKNLYWIWQQKQICNQKPENKK